MSEQPRTGSSNIGDQFEQVRQRVMDSGAVRTAQERIQAQGPELVERVKQLANEAMVRRIKIEQDGRTLFEFPLALGVGGALIAPQLAALGALAALITNCTITVERETPSTPGSNGSGGAETTSDASTGQPTGPT